MDAYNNLIEVLGMTYQNDGYPRIAGRLYGLMVVSEQSLSLQEIADKLQISKASASTNARLLQENGFIRRVSHPGQRQDYYELAPFPMQQQLEKILQLKILNARLVTEALDLIPQEATLQRERVTQLKEIQDAAVDILKNISQFK